MSNESNKAAETKTPCEHCCGAPATHIVCWDATAIRGPDGRYEVIHGVHNPAVDKTELCKDCSELVANDKLAYDEIGNNDDDADDDEEEWEDDEDDEGGDDEEEDTKRYRVYRCSTSGAVRKWVIFAYCDNEETAKKEAQSVSNRMNAVCGVVDRQTFDIIAQYDGGMDDALNIPFPNDIPALL